MIILIIKQRVDNLEGHAQVFVEFNERTNMGSCKLEELEG